MSASATPAAPPAAPAPTRPALHLPALDGVRANAVLLVLLFHRLLSLAGFLGVAGLQVWRGTVADTDRGMATVGYSVMAFAWGTFLVAALSGGWITRLLRARVLRWCGQRSFALYVSTIRS